MSNKTNLKDKILSFRLASYTEICQELGQRLKIQRLTKRFKQQELADRAGISIGTVKNLESKGQSSLETLVRVITALDLVHELEPFLVFRAQSIAQMEKIEKIKMKKIPQRVREKMNEKN
jgi:transcriptional regulator with XRE-family HTH domain